MKALAVAICVFLTAAPALAQMSGTTSGSGGQMRTNSDEQDVNDPAPTAAANGERLICRRVDPPSGSRVSTRRVCRTAEQWRDAQRD